MLLVPISGPHVLHAWQSLTFAQQDEWDSNVVRHPERPVCTRLIDIPIAGDGRKAQTQCIKRSLLKRTTFPVIRLSAAQTLNNKTITVIS